MNSERKKVLVEIFRGTIVPKTIEKLMEENVTREDAIKFFLDPLDQMKISKEDKQELTRLATLAVNNFFNKLERRKAGQNILNQLT